MPRSSFRTTPSRRIRARLLVVAAIGALIAVPAVLGSDGGGASWPMIGHDPANSPQPAVQSTRSGRRPCRTLIPKWVATTTGDVSGTPAVVDGAVYFGDFGGTLWKLDADTGAVDLVAPGLRTTPGSRATSRARARRSTATRSSSATSKAPFMLGIDATTGALRWKTQVHPDLARDHDRLAGARRRHRHHRRVGDPVRPRPPLRPSAARSSRSTRRRARSSGGPTRFPTTAACPAATRARRCSRRRPSTSRPGSSTARSGSRTRSRRASPRATRRRRTGSASRASSRASYLESIVAFDLKTGTPRWSYRV